ncbi:MAG TPA: GNAT family N-acetyltransferase, partial [Tepidisphaeraceae bacterium]|nr:GNAT family N-acetyltransferase [Tepidisphaeraceae bacterium]
MSTNVRWVGRESSDAIIDTRLKCYAGSMHDRARYRTFLETDVRTHDGDVLLLEQAGQIVGTMTSLSFTLHAQSASFPCQGVAWVGTIKTARRKRAPGQRGIASQVMLAGLDRARERGEVVSALMPFRASFYEHFGYGVVERRNRWTIPISLIPAFDSPGLRFFDPDGLPALAEARTR